MDHAKTFNEMGEGQDGDGIGVASNGGESGGRRERGEGAGDWEGQCRREGGMEVVGNKRWKGRERNYTG